MESRPGPGSAPPAQAAAAAEIFASPSPTYTLTPFLPVGPTATSTPLPTATAAPTQTPTPAPTFTPTRPPLTGVWNGIDFHDTTQSIELTIHLTGAPFNSGSPLTIGFRPGRPCAYYDFRACINIHDGPEVGVILATVHSGVGGDGQPLRHALEGTGFSQAGLPLYEIHNRMESLVGAPATLRQGESSGDDLRVRAAARIPPDRIADYFTSPLPDALDVAAQDSPAMQRVLKSRKPMLVIETCGWRHPEEYGIPGATDSTGSVYLLVIQ